MTRASLWSYYRHKMNDDVNQSNNPGNYDITYNKAITSKFLHAIKN